MIEVKEDYSLKPYNTFAIDVKCRYFVESDEEEALRAFVADYEWQPSEVLILGGGSNFLFTEDFTGTVFYPAMQGKEVIKEDEEEVWVRIGAGVEWDDFVAWTVEQGWGGVENLSFIPGHVGAAPVQNVGAYGMEAGERIDRVVTGKYTALPLFLCAMLAMFVIIPAMATTGADLGNGGPGLMFVSVLPVFNGIGGISRLIVIFFYVAILFAGISSIINLFETPVNFLQQQLHLKRWMAVGLIHVVGLIVALLIQPWTSQWMDIVSIYILPLGAVAAGIMFFWVMKKKDALAAAQLGSDKPIMKWFMPFGKYVFVPLCIACFVLGIWWGGIG